MAEIIASFCQRVGVLMTGAYPLGASLESSEYLPCRRIHRPITKLAPSAFALGCNAE